MCKGKKKEKFLNLEKKSRKRTINKYITNSMRNKKAVFDKNSSTF